MSIDRSLRMTNSMIRKRNVLTRAQRIAELSRTGKFQDGESSPFGLPKVRVIKATKRTKKKKEKKE